MAIGIAYAAIALGVGFGLLSFVVTGLGSALLGLMTPEAATRFGLKPITHYRNSLTPSPFVNPRFHRL